MTFDAARLVSTAHLVDDDRAAEALCQAKGWTDGLPVIPPLDRAGVPAVAVITSAFADAAA